MEKIEIKREIEKKNFFHKIHLLFFLFSILYLLLPNVYSDVISLNGGGDSQIIINPEKYIEGFFSCTPLTCSQLGYNCGSWSDNCGNTISCGGCSSGYTCQNGICTGIETPPEGGGGEGGAGGGELTPTNLTECSIVVNPASINLTLSFNPVTGMIQRVNKNLTIFNSCNYPQKLNAGLFGNINGIVLLPETSITVGPNETKNFEVTFVSPIYNDTFIGAILFNNVKKVDIFIKSTSNPLWFDANIVVLNKDYRVPQGDKLKTRVEMIPMGDKNKIDVTLNYEIKDYQGKSYLKKSETVLAVMQSTKIDRNFETGSLPLGRYVINLQLIYPGGVAPSSAYFEIVEKSPEDIFGLILMIIGILIFLIILIIIFIIIKRKKDKEREEEEEELEESEDESEETKNS
jgi:hypothetical protein